MAGEHEPQPLRAAPRRRHDHEELDCAAAAEEQEGSKQRKHAATGSTIAGAGPRPGSTEASTAVPQYKLVLRYQYHGTSLYRGTTVPTVQCLGTVGTVDGTSTGSLFYSRMYLAAAQNKGPGLHGCTPGTGRSPGQSEKLP